MAVKEQAITKNYAIYNGDSMEVMAALPENKIHFTIYSPPFGGLYHYSSSERDLSNCDNYEDFFNQYSYFIKELHRITMPGRMTAVHCADIPSGNSGNDHLVDFTGDVIRAHTKEGWLYVARYAVWKEPFGVRLRTMAKGLAHKTIVDDSSKCTNAAADYLVIFRKPGDNPEPIEHPEGLNDYGYAGSREIPKELLDVKDFKGNQIENRYSHWIWRQYASAFWDDVRLDRVLPFKESRDEEDEKHVHPLQLDVIERAIILWTNPGDTVLTPFMGVGSEVYGAVGLGRKGIGVELKTSYYNQAVKNMESVGDKNEQQSLFEGVQ
jgi:DNA modification methylase